MYLIQFINITMVIAVTLFHSAVLKLTWALCFQKAVMVKKHYAFCVLRKGWPPVIGPTSIVPYWPPSFINSIFSPSLRGSPLMNILPVASAWIKQPHQLPGIFCLSHSRNSFHVLHLHAFFTCLPPSPQWAPWEQWLCQLYFLLLPQDPARV